MSSKLKKEKQARDRCLPVPRLGATSPFPTTLYCVKIHSDNPETKSIETSFPDLYLEENLPKYWNEGWWEYEVVGFQPPAHPNAPQRQEIPLLGLILQGDRIAIITTKIDLKKQTKTLYVPRTGDPNKIYYDENHITWGTVLERNFLKKELALQIALHYLRHYQWPKTVLDKRQEAITINWEERPYIKWQSKNGRLHKTMNT